MPLAAALELVLNQYDIYDINDLVAILRSPVDSSQVADLIDESRALLDDSTRQRAGRAGDSDGGRNDGQRDWSHDGQQLRSATPASATPASRVQCSVQCR